MSDRSDNTMVEGLQKVLADVNKLKLCADADMPFIISLETKILDKLKNPVQQMQQSGDLPQDGAPQAGGPPPDMGGGMGGMPPPPPGGGMQGGGLMPGAAAPNADELRRLLSGGQ